MIKKIYFVFLVFLFFTACSNNSIIYTKDEGSFSKAKSEVITSKYKVKSDSGFFASIDFELKEGKVDWQILNPKGEVIFEGYAISENGTTYRQLTYPLNYLDGELNEKQEVKPYTDTKGNINNVADFNYLQFQVGSPSGEYVLNLKPSDAEGKFTVSWSNGLVKK